MKRRRLGDLYVRGKALEVSDGEGESVPVWLNKLNTIDREAVLRRANAAKARYLIDSDDEESDQFHAVYAETRELDDRDTLITFVIGDEVARAQRRIEAELAADEDGWGKDGHLQGLLDAWVGDDDNPGLSDRQNEDPDDPEVRRVSDELARYEKEVEAALKAETERLRKDWADVDLDMLRRKAAHKLIELRGTETFVKEYRRQQLFYALREPSNHSKRYFSSIAEIDDLDDALREYLIEQYESLVVPPSEGKESPPTADSSNSSESPVTDPVPGPEAAPA